MSREELLSIRPLWALQPYEMEFPYHHYSMGEYSFMEVDVAKFIMKEALLKHTLNLDDIFNGSWPDEQRYISTLERWAAKNSVDPPLCTYNSRDGIKIDDGRHRAVLAYYLKEVTMPITLSLRLSTTLS